MNNRQLKSEFDKLKGEYSLLDTTNERKEEIKKEMCDNLIKRNGGSNKFSDKLEINANSFVNELYEADGILNKQGATQKMEAVSDIARKSAFEKNKYSPDNSYSLKSEWQ